MTKTDSVHARPSIAMTLVLLMSAACFMAVFFALAHVVGITNPAFGLMFLVYWAAILRQDLSVFVPSVLGGIAGITLGWLLVAILPPLGPMGIIISLLCVAAVLFCFMRGHARLIVNNSLMLFLTMATIAELDVRSHVLMMIGSLLLGAAYMGATTVIVAKLRARAKPIR